MTRFLAGVALLGSVVLTATPGLPAAGRGLRLATPSATELELLRIERTLQKIERLRDLRERQERAERWREPPPPHPSQAGEKQDR